MRFLLLCVLAALAGHVHVSSQVVPPSHYPPQVAALMNFSVDPCVDFFEYACGSWISQTTIPSDSAVYNRAFSSIGDRNIEILINILNNASTPYPKIQSFYQNCMDTNSIDRKAFAPLQKYWDAITVNGDDSVQDFMRGVAFLHTYNIPAFFSFSVQPDPENPQTLIGEFDQGGLVLPDPAMYNATTPAAQQLLADYQKHVEVMFALAEDEDPAARAKEVLELETLLASVTLPGDQIRDPYSVYHKIDLTGLQSLTPNLDWSDYLVGIGAPDLTSLNVGMPGFFEGANKIISTAPAQMLQTHLRWNLLHAVANFMPSAFVNETFSFFGQELRGQSVLESRNKTCVAATDAALGNILGQAYNEAAFGPVAQQMITAMVGQIEDTFSSVVTALDWMDDDTKAKAQLKLSKVTKRVGAPATPSFYPGYEVLAGEYLESTMQKRVFDFNATVVTLGGAPDKNAWQMTADTVNAYYNPQDNSINFPAGILQDPFFGVDHDPAQNFGGMGMIMGHELTHGFDDQGRMYDGDGKLTNWWSNSSADHYSNSTRCMANQYSQFQVLPGVYINGNLTLGENIADNGGIKNGLYAYLKFVHSVKQGHHASLMRELARLRHPRVRVQHGRPQFVEDRPLFFAGFAQGWCAKATDAYLKLQVVTDVHSNFRFRVLGPLMNLPEFSSTFQCPAGSPMNPTNRCTVW